MTITTTATESRIVVITDPEWKARVQAASETRDGGNVSRMVRRALERLIEEERLLESDKDDKVA